MLDLMTDVSDYRLEKVKKLTRYHISEDNLPNLYNLLKKEVVLLFLGLGGLNYVPIAYQNGSTMAIKIIDAVTTAILGVMVLYKSGETYYQVKIKPQYPDAALQGIIESPLTMEKFWKEFIIQLILAEASSAPLATTLFDAHLAFFEQHPGYFWACFAFILEVNTAMHLVPIEIIMRNPVYGFPLHLFSPLWRFLFPPTVKELQDAEEKEQRNQTLQETHFILAIAKKNFFNQLTRESQEQIQERINQYTNDPEQLLQDMLSCYAPIAPLNPYLKNTARILGALTVSTACLGYAANPYLVFRNYFGFSVGASIGLVAIPIYFFMVLMAFFGELIGLRLLQDILSLKDILIGKASLQQKLPTTAKIYPYAFGIAAIGVLCIVAFAGAPGREMMKMAFNDVFPAWLMFIMQGIVDLGIGVLLGSYVPFDFTKMTLGYYARFCDDGWAKNIITLETKVEALLNDFTHINPKLAQTLADRIKTLMPQKTQPDLELNSGNAYRNDSSCIKFSSKNQQTVSTVSPLYELST